MPFLFSRTPRGLEDVSQYPELFATLLASGMWTIDDLKKLAGLNFLRVFKEVERVGKPSTIGPNLFLKSRLNFKAKLFGAKSLYRSRAGMYLHYSNTQLIVNI